MYPPSRSGSLAKAEMVSRMLSPTRSAQVLASIKTDSSSVVSFSHRSSKLCWFPVMISGDYGLKILGGRLIAARTTTSANFLRSALWLL
jgi:hypothetical protein